MSGPFEPRSHVILSTKTADPVLHRPPYNVELEDLGAMRIYCGNGVLIGTANDASSNRPIGISMTITMAGCSCGCRAPGRGIETMPSVDDARMLAAQLIEAADLVETGAKQTASELIGRASGK